MQLLSLFLIMSLIFKLEELLEKCRIPNPVLADLKGIYKKDDAESLGFNYFRL